MRNLFTLEAMTALVAIVVPLLLFPAFALEEFHSSEFGFSIKYPDNWVVDDEVVEFEPMPGFDDGYWGIVYFSDAPEFFNSSIEVAFIKNESIARNNEGQRYVDRVDSRLAEFCETAVMEIDEFECSNFIVTDSKITEHKGLPAYRFTQTWTEIYPDGSSLDLKSVLIDIVDGNDVWTIDGISIESEFQKFEPTIDEVIESFSLKSQSDSEPYTEPTQETNSESSGGGCLIATATYGSELAPQVQQLRELRDNKLLQTESGSAFMESFNDFYYSFSPIIADYERENPYFKETVKIAITPMISSLSILNHADMDSEAEVLVYGISLILLNVGMYVGVPTIVVIGIRKRSI